MTQLELPSTEHWSIGSSPQAAPSEMPSQTTFPASHLHHPDSQDEKVLACQQRDANAQASPSCS